MNKITIYFKESYKELTEKVTWPTWTQLQQSTMIVLVATLVITALVWLMDFAIAGALKFIYEKLFNS
jgi:preprotein translocase subunit SecE